MKFDSLKWHRIYELDAGVSDFQNRSSHRLVTVLSAIKYFTKIAGTSFGACHLRAYDMDNSVGTESAFIKECV